MLFLGVIQTGLTMLNLQTYLINLVQGAILIVAVLVSTVAARARRRAEPDSRSAAALGAHAAEAVGRGREPFIVIKGSSSATRACSRSTTRDGVDRAGRGRRACWARTAPARAR